jgi:hypothetical protein
MELRAAPVKVGLTMPAVAVRVVDSPHPRRWPLFVLGAVLTGVAAMLNATIVGALVGIPLFLVALSLFMSPPV